MVAVLVLRKELGWPSLALAAKYKLTSLDQQ